MSPISYCYLLSTIYHLPSPIYYSSLRCQLAREWCLHAAFLKRQRVMRPDTLEGFARVYGLQLVLDEVVVLQVDMRKGTNLNIAICRRTH